MKRWTIIGVLMLVSLVGCRQGEKPYGTEVPTSLPGNKKQVWAVAPAVNLSGESVVDPLLQSDLLFQQLQQVRGLTVVPVNRVVEVYMRLGIDRIQSMQQAALVCRMLSVDGLMVPSITIYDAYNPPKMGASLQLFAVKPQRFGLGGMAQGGPAAMEVNFFQAAGMFDAANGSVREDLQMYAGGRYEPSGPLGMKEYLVNMDRYCGFVYHRLIRDLLRNQTSQSGSARPPVDSTTQPVEQAPRTD
ncbi:MAG: hypothetical protein IT448_05610 [Phycisphaerales bacterium]|nr:hypothetical protein [Phycisphaerales bacterium]